MRSVEGLFSTGESHVRGTAVARRFPLLGRGVDPAAARAAEIQEAATLAGHSEGVECLAFSPRGNLLVTGGCDKTVKVWDMATLAELATHGHDGVVNDDSTSAPENRWKHFGSRR